VLLTLKVQCPHAEGNVYSINNVDFNFFLKWSSKIWSAILFLSSCMSFKRVINESDFRTDGGPSESLQPLFNTII